MRRLIEWLREIFLGSRKKNTQQNSENRPSVVWLGTNGEGGYEEENPGKYGPGFGGPRQSGQPKIERR